MFVGLPLVTVAVGLAIDEEEEEVVVVVVVVVVVDVVGVTKAVIVNIEVVVEDERRVEVVVKGEEVGFDELEVVTPINVVDDAPLLLLLLAPPPLPDVAPPPAKGFWLAGRKTH